MLLTNDGTFNPPPSEAAFQRDLKSRRIQLVAGLIPGDSRSGYSIFGACNECGQMSGRDITLASGKGDTLRWDCICGEPQETTLGDEFPLAPLGSDAAPLTGGGHSR